MPFGLLDEVKHPDSDTEDEYEPCQGGRLLWWEFGELKRLVPGARCTAQAVSRQLLMDADALNAGGAFAEEGHAHLCAQHAFDYLQATTIGGR